MSGRRKETLSPGATADRAGAMADRAGHPGASAAAALNTSSSLSPTRTQWGCKWPLGWGASLHNTTAGSKVTWAAARHEPGGCPTRPPGNRLALPPARAPGRRTLIDTAPGLPAWRLREEVGFGKRSLNRWDRGQRPLLGGCQALADKGPGGRMNHQALSASFVLARGSLNSAS
jgi:hypothetical protein